MGTLKNVIKQIEIWYIFMIVVGAFNVGFNIMLIPQHIAATFTDGMYLIGIVMAAWTAGPLIGPMISKYIDRLGKPRNWVSILLLANSVLAFVVPYCTTIPLLFLNMLFQGFIYAVTYSILNLLIVRRFESNEWYGRTSMLIAAFIIGEVIGFGVAGHVPTPMTGVHLGAIVMLGSSILAMYLVPDFNKQPAISTEKTVENLDIVGLVFSPFGIMAFGWALLCFSAQILFLPFPVLMREVFSVDPTVSSSVVSISGIIALIFFPMVGKLTSKFGADNVLIASSSVKAAVFAVLGICALNYSSGLMLVVLGMIFLNRCTWPFMMAGSLIQATQLSADHSKSMALTVFMAFAGFGNMLSGVMNSFITAKYGMEYVPIVAALAACIGILLLIGNKYRGDYANHYSNHQQKHHP